MTIILDEAPDETLAPDAPIDAFGSCPDSGERSRGFTVRFELRWAELGTVASLQWSMGARASFPDADEVPPDALLTAQVDGRTDAALDGALTDATASGAFEVDGHAQVSIQMHANSAALPGRAFGYLPPNGGRLDAPIVSTDAPKRVAVTMRVAGEALRLRRAAGPVGIVAVQQIHNELAVDAPDE